METTRRRDVTRAASCLAVVAFLAALPWVVGPEPADAQPPVVMKLGTKMPPENPEGRAFQRFADLAEEKSRGRIKVNVFPSEQLGTGTTQIDNVLLATQDMYAEGSTFLDRFHKDFRLSSIPYLFLSNEHYQRVVTGSLGQELNQAIIAKGLRIINTRRNFLRGPYRVICAKRPIKSLEDVKGLRLRSFESAIYVNAWKYLGANPTVIAWTETYLALKQNVVEAVTLPISLLYSMKFTEAASHCTQINEFPQDVVIVMNERRFQSLAPDLRQALVDAGHEAGEFATKLVIEAATADIDRMKKEHGAQFYQVDLKPFADKMEPYFKELEKQGFITPGVVDRVRAAARG